MIAICKCGRKYTKSKTTQVRCPKCEFARFLKNKTIKPPIKEKFNWTKKKKSEKERAKDNAWKWCSRYVRMLHTKDGYGRCYTCGGWHTIYKLEAGHFISRAVATTRYNLNNLRPQCKSCNGYKQGMPHVFRANLVEELGVGPVEELESLAREIGDDSISYHQGMAAYFRDKLRALEAERGVKHWD
jgi:DNA-directed RNA polymerase subunit RPC12/RpoP